MRKGGGRVHCKFVDFEGGGSWRFGLEKSQVMWNSGLYIVDFQWGSTILIGRLATNW